MAKQITDEMLIASLMTHKTIKEAAASVGCSERSIYSRMRDAEFEETYKCARLDVLRGVVSEVTLKAQDALEIVVKIMHDEDVSAQTRLNAANCILQFAERAQSKLRQEEITTMPTAPIEQKMMLDML